MIERINQDGSKHPTFIGCWMLENTSICDDLMEFFEHNHAAQTAGVSSSRKVQENIKKSTDISISPFDLENENFNVVSRYIEQLKLCYLDYLEQWEFLKSTFPRFHIGPFNLRRYDEGGHFQELHAERTSLNSLHRVLAWMTYLNDVPEEGETEFPMFGLKIKPEKGKTLIWPAEWTHAHLGSVVKNGKKYIITGWMHFPIDT